MLNCVLQLRMLEGNIPYISGVFCTGLPFYPKGNKTRDLQAINFVAFHPKGMFGKGPELEGQEHYHKTNAQTYTNIYL